MKLLVLGDIHGRTIWRDIIEKENPDKVIFLGDYVSTHENISSDQQIENLYAILSYKETNSDKVVLLRGNHDIQHIGASWYTSAGSFKKIAAPYYWAECSGFDQKVWDYMSTEDVTKWYLSLTQWIYHIPNTNIVCSHAGIGEKFEDACISYLAKTTRPIYFNPMSYIDDNIFFEAINDIEPCELFGFTPCKLSDYSGESATQPCTWIRPYTLLQYGVKEIIHVVGHTPVEHICNIKEECLKARNKYNIKEGEEIVNNYCDVWCCDNLANGEYLIIEDREFKPCKL